MRIPEYRFDTNTGHYANRLHDRHHLKWHVDNEIRDQQMQSSNEVLLIKKENTLSTIVYRMPAFNRKQNIVLVKGTVGKTRV